MESNSLNLFNSFSPTEAMHLEDYPFKIDLSFKIISAPLNHETRPLVKTLLLSCMANPLNHIYYELSCL